MSLRLELTLDHDVCAPGDTIHGQIAVMEGGSSKSLEAFLEYREDTDDYSGVATGIPTGILHEGDLVAGTEFHFELSLPADAYPNFSSQHCRLYWQVHVRSDRRGRDTHEHHRIEVEKAR